MQFVKNTRRDTSKVLCLPREMTMEVAKVLRLPRELQLIFWKRCKKYCACHAKRLLTRYETCWNVTKCHACHAKRGYATSETSKSDHSCKTHPRHSHSDLTRTVANGCGQCERSRTVADVNATSSEHTLNPQTSRVNREPFLRIQEKRPGSWSANGAQPQVADCFAGGIKLQCCLPECHSRIANES